MILHLVDLLSGTLFPEGLTFSFIHKRCVLLFFGMSFTLKQEKPQTSSLSEETTVRLIR